jgi:MinD-like ATPase involved in chromosome partitioning or flagellar assembly
MSSKKRLGKSLEDISHLFLSGVSSAPSLDRVQPSVQKQAEGSTFETRVWLTLSLVPRLPSAFFTANLGVELARAGKRVLAIETAPVPSLDEVLGTVQIHPSLNDLLEQPQKQITVEGPLGMKLLSFQLRSEELQGFATEEQEILSQVLRKEEEDAELILIHAVYEENSAFQRWVSLVQGVVLTVDLNSETLLQTYQACKYLYQLHPDLRIGLMVFGHRDKDTAAAGMKRLSDAVLQFLGKSLEWYGIIPDDPLIGRSLTAKVPLTILDQTSKAASGFSSAARNLLVGTEGDSNRSGSGYSFFGRLQRTADMVGG